MRAFAALVVAVVAVAGCKTYSQYLDASGAVSASLGIAAVPATLLVERDGSYTVHSGVLDEHDLAAWIGDVSAEP